MKKLLLTCVLSICALALFAATPIRHKLRPLAGQLLSLADRTAELALANSPSAQQANQEAEVGPGDLSNLTAVGVDPSEFIEHPDPADITFVPPMQNDANGLRIGRLLLPRDGKWNEKAIAQVRRRQMGPFSHALLAVHDGDEARNEQAKALLLDGRRGEVYSSMKNEGFIAGILALDWIRWDSEAAFEAAAAKLIPAKPLRSAQFGKGAYLNNDHHPQGNGWGWETLLVAVCHGRPGPSGEWAAERLSHLTDDPTQPGCLYSPYHAANVLTVHSKRGGGRENCPTPSNKMGGYESYFASAGWVLWGWQTATGESLFTDNLYFRTRWQGFLLEFDPVEKAGRPVGDLEKLFACHAGLTNSSETAWMAEGVKYNDPRCVEFLACAPEPPAPVDPSPAEPVVDTVGSQWHYYSNPADRANAFHVTISCRDLSHYRYDNDDRTFGVTYKGVGLVMGGASYRGKRDARTANGLYLAGLPGDRQGVFPYWSPRRASIADTVASDPYYLVQTGGPESSVQSPVSSVNEGGTRHSTLNTGHTYHWQQDWLSLVDHGGTISKLVTDWEVDPASKRVVVSDTVRHDGSITPRLHFSPSHPVKVENDSFVISDGTNSIRVSVTSNHPLEWSVKDVPDKNKYSRGRVAQFMTATPKDVQCEVSFQTVVSVLD